jgi:hypothetical protein
VLVTGVRIHALNRLILQYLCLEVSNSNKDKVSAKYPNPFREMEKNFMYNQSEDLCENLLSIKPECFGDLHLPIKLIR